MLHAVGVMSVVARAHRRLKLINVLNCETNVLCVHQCLGGSHSAFMNVTHDGSFDPGFRHNSSCTLQTTSVVLFQSPPPQPSVLGIYTTRSRPFQVHALTDSCTKHPEVHDFCAMSFESLEKKLGMVVLRGHIKNVKAGIFVVLCFSCASQDSRCRKIPNNRKIAP